ncbi:hypothetical protein N0V93_001797 [Gnomoniopsis smithogilvyi]|uniref:Zn(2)-C6 fungal-type domain-containing protein n=1 Tax=Gnomoniopsis smithogilvyi TaxID=1191159 RepID=A0A9W9D320_9PEZI|nr:hypothetical protein N0V93_001797 [Gnomoniopsis smithogilvyi]
MSNAERRRNGSQASCEPCRKGKLRCDHQKPICAPCHRRGRESRCFYHPAPLTKPRASRSARSKASTVDSEHIQIDGLTPSTTPEDDVSQLRDSHTTAICTESTPRAHAWSFMYNEKPDSGLPSQPLVPDSLKNREEHLAALREITFLLRSFSLIERLVEEYFSFSQAAIVPHPIVRQLFDSIKTSLCDSEEVEDVFKTREAGYKESRLAARLLRSASFAINITPSQNLEAFCMLFSGERLRVETLGLLYTIAARSYLCGSRRDDNELENIVRNLIRCSSLSLHLSRELAEQKTNDLIVWLGLENVQLISLLEGHGSAWRRLGDLTTDVYALGTHREESYSAEKIPFYLAEFRRRTFGFVFYLDKAFSHNFSQPPRMSPRYTDCSLSLDLSDDEIVAATTHGLDQLQYSLNKDGWNTDGRYRNTTWARLRYGWSELEHIIIDLKFGPPHATDEQKLRDVLKKCRTSWDSLPQHLQYDPECWNSKLLPGTCLMLAKVYLCYLQLNFQIHKLLSRLGPDNTLPQPELLEISAKMLDTSVQIANTRGREGYFLYPVDLTTHVFEFGLPAAAILTTALQDAIRDSSKSLPSNIPRANLIRNVSVLICHIESVFANGGPHLKDLESCRQASKTISRRLDQVLEGVLSGPTGTVSTFLPERPDSSSTGDCTNFSAFAPLVHDEAVGLDGVGDFDFDTWATAAVFDLETTRHDWSLF